MNIPTSSNAAILFLDLQEEIVKNSATLPLDRLTSNAAGDFITELGGATLGLLYETLAG